MTISSSDRVEVTTLVAAGLELTFTVFTEELDLWWRHGPRHRTQGDRSMLRLEAGVGGRLLEYGGVEAVVLGEVLVWDPPRRLVLQWRRGFEEGEGTEVEVRFAAENARTRVTIEHRGWDRVPEGHRARQGLVGHAFEAAIGLWWGDLLVSLRARAKA